MDGTQQVDRAEHAYWTGEWEREGIEELASELNSDAARGIALQWASWLCDSVDRDAIEAYAATGVVSAHLVSLVIDYRHLGDTARPLQVLIAHILASDVMMWTYGYNRAGQLPVRQPARVLGGQHINGAWEIFLRELPDYLVGESDELGRDACTCGVDEWECEYHRATAFMESVIADSDHLMLPGEDRVSISLLVDEVPWEAWLIWEVKTVQAYLAGN